MAGFLTSASFVAQRVSAHCPAPLIQGCAHELELEVDFVHLFGRRQANDSYCAVLQLRGEFWGADCSVECLDNGIEQIVARIPFIAPEHHGLAQGSVVIQAEDENLLTIDLGLLSVAPNDDDDVLDAVLLDGTVLRRLHSLSKPLEFRLLDEVPDQPGVVYTNVYPVIVEMRNGRLVEKFEDESQKALLARIVGRCGRELRQLRRKTGAAIVPKAWTEQADHDQPFEYFEPTVFVDKLTDYLRLVGKQEPLHTGRTMELYVSSFQAITEDPFEQVEPDAPRLFMFGFGKYLLRPKMCAVDLSRLVELALTEDGGAGCLTRQIPTIDPPWMACPEAVVTLPGIPQNPDLDPHFLLEVLTRPGVFVDSSGRCTGIWVDWGEINQGVDGPLVRGLISGELGRVLRAIASHLEQDVTVCVGEHHPELSAYVMSAGFPTYDFAQPLDDGTAVVCFVPFDTQLADLAGDLRKLRGRRANVVCTLAVFSLNAAVPARQGTLINLALYRFDENSTEPRWVDMKTPGASLLLMPYLSS
jgi:hypothetical protein